MALVVCFAEVPGAGSHMRAVDTIRQADINVHYLPRPRAQGSANDKHVVVLFVTDRRTRGSVHSLLSER